MQAWRIRRAFQHQVRHLRRKISGKPLDYPPLGSVTLEKDDVDLARQWLRRPKSWADDALVLRYQEQFAAWNGSLHANAFMGGRVALSACIHALSLRPGDEAIMPGYTCVVVPNAFSYAGVRPVYCDIELETYGPDLESLKSRITPRTRAILIHHLYGLVCRDYQAIIALANRLGIPVIEDCAHATGARYGGVRVGNLGQLAIYSSEQSKVFCTIQGGIATTNDSVLARRLQEFWDNASVPEDSTIDRLLHCVLLNYYGYIDSRRWLLKDIYEVLYGGKQLISTSDEEVSGIKPKGYGARMPAPIAALAMNQLEKVDRFNAVRRSTAREWDHWCSDAGRKTPLVLPDSEPVFLRYPVLVEPEKKSDRSWAKHELGVSPGVWYRTHIHPASMPVHGCPNADSAVARCVNLPTLLRKGR